MILAFLSASYLWVKALHVVSVIAWMAGLFYLPRLFVYHAERGTPGSALDGTFRVMERRLLRAIMTPAMLATWIFGLMLVATPGVVDWQMVWPWMKAAGVIGMTLVHFWLAGAQKRFARGENRHAGRVYRMVNEVPTVLMLVIVFMVIARPW
ncbi:MAG: protoporphyrinogen oxidase HemJ [Rubellimicrobium sp.]|nr:protoporphyrinogen oxidase HemJ [Rubellimicrobium sp.]